MAGPIAELRRYLQEKVLFPREHLEPLRQDVLAKLVILQEEAAQRRLYPRREDLARKRVIDRAADKADWVIGKIIPAIEPLMLQTGGKIRFTGINTGLNSNFNCEVVDVGEEGEEQKAVLKFGHSVVDRDNSRKMFQEAWDSGSFSARQKIEIFASLPELKLTEMAYAAMSRMS